MTFKIQQAGPRRLALLLSLSLLPLVGCELGVVGGVEDETFADGERNTYGTPGSSIGKYWVTYYYLADQSRFPGSGYPLYSKSCTVLVSSTYSFYKAAQMEGSARLNSGQVINWAGYCTCGGSKRSCFTMLPSSQPWGRGAFSNALIPLRSIAVDKNRIKLGSAIYIKQWDGVQIPSHNGIGGFVHDGCFRADDTGGAIKGSHYDFFAGTKAMWKALENKYGTKTYFSMYHGGSKCAYVKGLKPGQQGMSGGGSSGGGSSGGGSSGGGSNGGSNGYGDCFYGGERGTCQPDNLPCSGSYKGSICPGPSNVRCCMPPSNNGGNNGGSSTYGSCTYAARTGTCQSTSLSCGGGYQSGLCPGGNDIKCCLPSFGSCSSGGKTGNCQLTTASCSSGYKSGLCPGPNSVKCCLN